MEASNANVKNGSDKQECDEWVIGSGRNRVLRFTCDALSCLASSLPALKLYLTFKSVQAETKLLSFLLIVSHGFNEMVARARENIHMPRYCEALRFLWYVVREQFRVNLIAAAVRIVEVPINYGKNL
ncbi:hypothetical protein V9T40_007073 [Parthenolecanium corni]|uniref:Uncharacterized protein n=1 Tax=Parthenolecanium corni TaxID=536013 RepID=A0AAN9TY45_9HEMI